MKQLCVGVLVVAVAVQVACSPLQVRLLETALDAALVAASISDPGSAVYLGEARRCLVGATQVAAGPGSASEKGLQILGLCAAASAGSIPASASPQVLLVVTTLQAFLQALVPQGVAPQAGVEFRVDAKVAKRLLAKAERLK